MFIRDMEISDMEALSELYSEYWGEKSDVEKMRRKFTEIQSNPAYILLCAVESGRLIGTVYGIVNEELYGDCTPFLVAENMIVAADFRRNGIGRALFSEMESRAREVGCRQVILVTESIREDACAFYASLGFSPTANKGFKKKI